MFLAGENLLLALIKEMLLFSLWHVCTVMSRRVEKHGCLCPAVKAPCHVPQLRFTHS